MKYLTKRTKDDNRGATTIEIVTTIALMVIVLPAMIVLLTSTINTKDTASVLLSNTLSVSGVQKTLNNDIRTASAIQVIDGQILNLRSSEGLCKTWKISENNLVRAEANSEIDDYSDWVTVGVNFSAIEPNALFNINSRSVEYNFSVGKDTNTTDFTGAATQAAVNSGSGECW